MELSSNWIPICKWVSSRHCFHYYGFTHTSTRQISFSEFLIPATAGVAIMFIMGTLSVLFYLAPDAESPKHATKALGGFFLIGLFGLLVIIPLLIAQFTFFGAIGVAIVVVISIAVWIKHGIPLNYKI